MEFHIFTKQLKKRKAVQIHTPSCSRNATLKKNGQTFTKMGTDYVEDVLAVNAGAVVHERCCKLFHKPTTNNPPCPKCKSASTVFASNIGVGKREFSCTSCKKLFVVNRPTKEKVMKIRIHKNSASKVRAEKRAERQAAREVRREERKAKRIARMGTRLTKMVTRFQKLGVDTTALESFVNTIVVKATTAKVARKAKAKTAAPKARAKKTTAKAGKPAAKKSAKKTAAKRAPKNTTPKAKAKAAQQAASLTKKMAVIQ